MFTLKDILKSNVAKTPFYFYDLALLRRTLFSACDASGKYGYSIHYAFKANVNARILEIIRSFNIGADCVSGGEIRKAIETGFPPKKILFAGVGKTDEEIEYALACKVFCLNCESLDEINVVNELAGKAGAKANIALRVNPDVKAYTHQYITTGLEENKFGIHRKQLPEALDLILKSENIRLSGLHFHIGSQITNLEAFRSLCLKVNEIQHELLPRNISIEHINVGGGLGINYSDPGSEPVPDFGTYFKIFHDFLELYPSQKLHFELGRSLMAQCGSLISKVLYVKKGVSTNFIVLDAGMTELIRPALYSAYHKIENLSSLTHRPSMNPSTHRPVNHFKYDVVGPVCESSDCFGKAVLLPETFRGDIIAILSAGAYGEVMSSSYNLREKVRAVYSD